MICIWCELTVLTQLSTDPWWTAAAPRDRITHTTVLTLTAQRAIPAEPALCARWITHTREEKGHDLSKACRTVRQWNVFNKCLWMSFHHLIKIIYSLLVKFGFSVDIIKPTLIHAQFLSNVLRFLSSLMTYLWRFMKMKHLLKGLWV